MPDAVAFWNDDSELCGAELGDDVLLPAPLVDAAPALPLPLFSVQGVPGPPGPQGPPGTGVPAGTFAELDLGGGVVVFVPLLPVLAVAQGATTPALGALERGIAWSSVLSALVTWNGVSWQQVTGGGGPVVDPLTLVNDAGDTLINDQGEVILAG